MGLVGKKRSDNVIEEMCEETCSKKKYICMLVCAFVCTDACSYECMYAIYILTFNLIVALRILGISSFVQLSMEHFFSQSVHKYFTVELSKSSFSTSHM